MFELCEKHDPVPDCDCRECAVVERNRLRAALAQSVETVKRMRREGVAPYGFRLQPVAEFEVMKNEHI